MKVRSYVFQYPFLSQELAFQHDAGVPGILIEPAGIADQRQPVACADIVQYWNSIRNLEPVRPIPTLFAGRDLLIRKCDGDLVHQNSPFFYRRIVSKWPIPARHGPHVRLTPPAKAPL